MVTYTSLILFGKEVLPAELHSKLYGKRDGANTSYAYWSWESDDVQVPLNVIGGICTLGTSIEAQGFIRVIGILNVTNTAINLTGLDAKIPGYNNAYFKTIRDVTFVVTDFSKGIPKGVFEIPATVSDINALYNTIDMYDNE